MPYTKISVDDFPGSSLDATLWRDYAVGGVSPGEFTVSGSNLTIAVGANDPQLFVNSAQSGKVPGYYDLTNSIYAFKYSKIGSPTSSSAELDFVVGDSENDSQIGIRSLYNTNSWSWTATGGPFLTDETGTSSGLGTDWVDGNWLGLGLIGDDGVVHLLKSADGVTWAEIGSASIYSFGDIDGVVFDRRNLYIYIAPYDLPSDSATISIVLDEIAIFWNGQGTYLPAGVPAGNVNIPSGTRLQWDTLGKNLFQTGIDRGMLYIGNDVAVPWNGLIDVTETADSGNAQEFFIDGDKVLDIQAQEDFAATVDAYSAPIEFAPCAGRLKLSPGLYATGQRRKLFGFSYRTLIGNDISGTTFAYKINVVYNAQAQVSDSVNASIGASPSPKTYSLNIVTVPSPVIGQKPTAHIVIDSRTVSSFVLSAIENVLYGDSTHAPRLPSVQQLLAIMQGSGVAMHKMSLFSYDYISGFGEITMHKMGLSGTEGKIFGTGSIQMHKPVLTGAGTVTPTGSTRRVGAALGYGALNDDDAASFLSIVGGSRYGISHFFYGSSVPADLASASKDLAAEQTASRRACLDFELTHYGVGGSPAAGAVTDKSDLISFLTDCQSNGLDFIVCLWHEPYNKFNLQSTQTLNNLDYTNSMSYYGSALRAIGVDVLFCVSNYSANHHFSQTIGTATTPGLGWAACSAGLIDEVYTDWYVNEGNSGTTPAGSGIQGTWSNIQALADDFSLPLGILELGPAPATNAVNWNDTDIQAFLTLARNSLDSRAAAGKAIANIIWWATDDNATTPGMYLASNWSSGTLAKYQSMFDAYNGSAGPMDTGTGSIRMHKMKVSAAGTLNPSYHAQVLADSPSVYYRLGDASSPAVPDAGAGGVNASMNGTVTFGQTGALVGDSNKAVLFPGTTGNDLTTASAPGSAYDLGDGPWSIEFWYKVNTIGVQQDAVCKSTGAYIVRLSSANHLVLVLSGTGNIFSTTSTFLDTTGWHHVVITRVAATQPHIYVDGVDQAGTYTPGTFTDNTLPFRIGDGGVSSDPWHGLIDEVAIYKSVLSQARVTAHYNAGT